MKFHPHTYHLCCIRLIKSAFTSTEMSGKDVSSLTACKNSTNQTFLNEANLFDSLLHDVHIFPWYLARLIERQALFYLFTQLVAKHVRGHVCKKTSKTSAQYKEIEGRQKAHLCPWKTRGSAQEKASQHQPEGWMLLTKNVSITAKLRHMKCKLTQAREMALAWEAVDTRGDGALVRQVSGDAAFVLGGGTPDESRVENEAVLGGVSTRLESSVEIQLLSHSGWTVGVKHYSNQ